MNKMDFLHESKAFYVTFNIQTDLLTLTIRQRSNDGLVSTQLSKKATQDAVTRLKKHVVTGWI